MPVARLVQVVVTRLVVEVIAVWNVAAGMVVKVGGSSHPFSIGVSEN